MSKSRLIGRLLTAVLGLGLVACSAPTPTSPAGGASSAGSATAQQGVDNKVITIGLDSVLSGPSAVISQFSEATKVYLDMVNRNGGVNGYTFKVVERDSANQAAQGSAVAQQLINEDKVFAILAFGTPTVQAIVPVAPSLKAPILVTADSDLVRTTPNMYGFNPRYSLLPLLEAEFLIKSLNVKNVAYAYTDDSTGRPALKTLPDFVSASGGNLVNSLGFSLDTTDWAPLVTKLKDSGAEGVMVFNIALPSMQKAADAIGYHPKWLGNFGSLQPSYLKLAGPLAEGTYIDGFVQPVDATTPEAQKFNDEMKAAGKESIVGLPAAVGWSMGAAAEEAVRRATANGAALTWDSFMTGLNTFQEQPVGMYPSLTYTPQDHTGATRSAVYQVQNGKFIQVLPMTEIPQPGS